MLLRYPIFQMGPVRSIWPTWRMLWTVRLGRGSRVWKDEEEEGDMRVESVVRKSFGGMMRIGLVESRGICQSATCFGDH